MTLWFRNNTDFMNKGKWNHHPIVYLHVGRKTNFFPELFSPFRGAKTTLKITIWAKLFCKITKHLGGKSPIVFKLNKGRRSQSKWKVMEKEEKQIAKFQRALWSECEIRDPISASTFEWRPTCGRDFCQIILRKTARCPTNTVSECPGDCPTRTPLEFSESQQTSSVPLHL